MVMRSESIKELSKALAGAQSEIKGASKDTANLFFKSRYADLASVWDACRQALTNHGLAVAQPASADGAKVTVTTLLMHESGEWLESALTMTAKEDSPQAIGSCLTYNRRYSLASMVGVAPEDDDGEAAEGRQASSAPAVTKNGGPPKVSPEMTEAYKRDLDLLKAAKRPEELEAAAAAIKADEEQGLLTQTALKMLRNVYKERVQGIEAMVELGERLLPAGK